MSRPAPLPPYVHPPTRLRVNGVPVPFTAGVNVLAVGALIWSLVLFMVPIGPLLMAPIALHQIRRHGGRGRACALVALALAVAASALWVVIWVEFARHGAARWSGRAG